MKLQSQTYFFIFIISLFIGIVSVELFSDGMFMDGLLYASISRNMAEGMGSFWKPFLSQTLFPEFYEHPPLALGLQAIFFKLLGDSIYVERMYSLATHFIMGYLMVLIWKKITLEMRFAWIPLLFWILTSGVAWSASNNMLENTMGIFVCLSVYFYWKGMDRKTWIWVALSGLSLSLGLLTKGFFCLYLWGMPFFVWAFLGKKKFSTTVMDTLIMVFFTVAPVAMLFFTHIDAQHHMLSYFNKQVLGSIENVRTVDSRFAIVFGFFKAIVIPLILAFLLILLGLRRNLNRGLFKIHLREFLLFLTITMSGVVPIMISLKQRDFYILTVYPIFSIGLAYYVLPFVKGLFQSINDRSRGFYIFRIFTWTLLATSILLSAFQMGKVGRDRDMIHDTKTIISHIGSNKVIHITPEMFSIWSLHGYMMRYGHISLDYSGNYQREYVLIQSDTSLEGIGHLYEEVQIPLKKHKLYQAKKSLGE